MNYTTFLKTETWSFLLNLNAATPAQWGVMNAQNMVEHLRMVFALSLGFAQITPFVNEERTRKSYEFIIVQKNPLPKEVKFKNGFLAEPFPLEFADIEQAKSELKEAVNAFFERFENQNDLKTLHPVLGMLNFEEWQIFHTAHIRHHFEQFNLL